MQISTALNVPNVIMRAIRTWSPSKLFANSEKGVWYDPGSISTLYQDSAGTTPVTAVEQPVGKMLDKSGNGNHATQATSASRPTLSARVNLRTYSEQFDNAAWVKLNTTVAVTGYADPIGGTTARLMLETAATGEHRVAQSPTALTGSSVKQTVRVKAGGRDFCLLYDSNAGVGRFFSIPTDGTGAALGTFVGAPTASAINHLGGGWYDISITNVVVSSAAVMYLYGSTDGTTSSYAGDITKGIYIWGASLVTADQADLPYQRVNTATDYDTVGFPHYLKFDGVDDGLATGSIDFSAGDKMTVFAGVRKLSNALYQMAVELGTDASAVNGSFQVVTPDTSNTYLFRTRGTLSASATIGGYAPPTTNVLTGIGSISTDVATLRINGVQAATSAADQGTGNYGNYPLYIGRRGGTTLPFNGHLYSLIVRAAESTATDITNAETWVNGKTGAY